MCEDCETIGIKLMMNPQIVHDIIQRFINLRAERGMPILEYISQIEKERINACTKGIRELRV
jgi:hypothetical protein